VATTLAILPDSHLEPLPWDTEHMGFAVARIRTPRLTDAQLDAALSYARDSGVTLVYWPAAAGSTPEPGLLHCYRGSLVDRKAVFRANLTELTPPPSPLSARTVITEAAVGAMENALADLAVEAGKFSRFGVDPRMPRDKFEGLYRVWMERSLRRELADLVFVAHHADERRSALGMVTLSVSGCEGTIGLIAVHAAARRERLGQHLLWAAHGAMAARGASKASVVTQLANTAACRLYERVGYRLAEVTNFYHFWLQPARFSAA
jgi:dTDP-4-amino-4,6-dideoxy-D-galactose acyltransferase